VDVRSVKGEGGTDGMVVSAAAAKAASISTRCRQAFFVDVGLEDFIVAGSPAVGEVCSSLMAEQLRAVAIASCSDRSSALPLIVRAARGLSQSNK